MAGMTRSEVAELFSAANGGGAWAERASLSWLFLQLARACRLEAVSIPGYWRNGTLEPGTHLRAHNHCQGQWTMEDRRSDGGGAARRLPFRAVLRTARGASEHVLPARGPLAAAGRDGLPRVVKCVILRSRVQVGGGKRVQVGGVRNGRGEERGRGATSWFSSSESSS